MHVYMCVRAWYAHVYHGRRGEHEGISDDEKWSSANVNFPPLRISLVENFRGLHVRWRVFRRLMFTCLTSLRAILTSSSVSMLPVPYASCARPTSV